MKLGSYSCMNKTIVLRVQDSARIISPCTKIKSCLPKQDLRGQSVAVLGLGKSGISAARLALARDASVLAVDQNENLGPVVEQSIIFKDHCPLKTALGCFDNELLKETDIIVVSPGISLENYGLLQLLQSGKHVMSELDFAAEVLPEHIKIIAVTGTNGKSTVAAFAGQILDCLGIKTFAGANLGVPLSEAAFQCLTSPGRAFQVSVILNLTSDHLERHKTMKNHANTKCRILSRMHGHKIGILPLGNEYLNEAIKEHETEFNVAWIGAFPGVEIDLEAKVANFKLPTIGCASQVHLGAMKTIGTHNYQNASVAALAIIGLDIGINAPAISSVIGELRCLPHRMQMVHMDNHGVTQVDDSKATNVEAAYTGLMDLKERKSVILMGGIAKAREMRDSNGFEQLVQPLNHHRAVITFG